MICNNKKIFLILILSFFCISSFLYNSFFIPIKPGAPTLNTVLGLSPFVQPFHAFV